MFVVDNNVLDGFERHDDDVVDFLKTLFGFISAIGHLEVESKMFDRPFAAVLLGVLVTEFLNGDVGEVDEHIVHLPDIRRVKLVTKTTKALFIEIGFDRAIRGNEDVDSKIKLFATHKKWIINVFTNNICFIHIKPFKSIVEIRIWSYFLQLINFLQQKYSYIIITLYLALEIYY